MAFSLTKDSTLTVKARCTRKAASKTELKPNEAELNSIGGFWTLHEKTLRSFYSLAGHAIQPLGNKHAVEMHRANGDIGHCLPR